MRWLAFPWCGVLALAGCGSEPLESPVAGEDTAIPPAPAGASDGAFRPVATYPAGPYGSERGSIIADHSFLGWRDPVRSGFDETRLEEVRFSDFYGAGARRGATELIVVNASAVWCPACRSEMAAIARENLADEYRLRNVVLLCTLFEDVSGAPAKPLDLALWGNGLNFTVDFPLVLDPGLKLGPYFSESVTPLNLVIDGRTMEILEVFMGYSGALWSYVDNVLTQRGIAPPP
jgi:thiol-disulfide isomerase/thioredoxin